jgi:GntR family transcriptional regulator
MLDKKSPIPLYYQLVEAIRDRIRAGGLTPGAQLPPERELGEQYGISRMTVRQALQYLISEGVLVARQGSGTFVAEPKLTFDLRHALGFTDEMMRRGADAASQVLEQSVVTPPESVAARLALPTDGRATRIVRLRLAAGVPLVLETVYVPTSLFPGLERENLTQHSLYRLMRDVHGVNPAGAHQTLASVPANEYEGHLLGVQPGTPMILVKGVTVDQDDQPIECFKAIYRGDRFEIAFDSRPSGTRDNVPHLAVVMR